MANRALAAERFEMMRQWTHRSLQSFADGARCKPLACAAIAFLVLAQFATAAHSQTVWEVEPYRIQVLMAVEPGVGLTQRFEQDLATSLAERTDLLVGAAWILQATSAETSLRHTLLDRLDSISPALLLSAFSDAKLDKLMLLAISADSGGYRVAARELDLRTRLLGTLVNMHVSQPAAIPDTAFDAVCAAFAPLAVVAETNPDEKTVTLRLRAGALPPRDPSLAFSQPGRVFRHMVRYNDRSGNLQRVTVVPWTYLVAEKVDGPVVTTRPHSGLRSAISGRQRGRAEQLALGVTPAGIGSHLRVQSRTEPRQPLEGYEIYGYSPDSRETRLLGRTDRGGRLWIPPGDHTLRLLLVKSGGDVLAKLPFVPGLEPISVAEVPDDTSRLEVEGFIVGLQEKLVDLVAEREVLMQRVRTRIKSGKLKDAQAAFDQLKRLQTRDGFAFEVQRQRHTLISSDRVVQAKIDKLFNDTESLLGRFLNPADVERLEAELNQARETPNTAQAGPPSKAGAPES